MNSKSILICIIGVFVFFACKKEEPDTTKPIISAISPKADSTLKSMPDSALIYIKFTDNKDLLHYNLQIIDSANKYRFDTAIFISGTEREFRKYLKIPYFGTKYKLKMHIKTVDNASNESAYDYNFFVNR